jgi:tRNA 2-thiouridine synthesizing protein A
MTDTATVTLDTSGLPCPAPLLGAKKLVDDLQPGQTLKLISDCQGTADDLFAWAKFTGNQVLESRKLAGRQDRLPHPARRRRPRHRSRMSRSTCVACPAPAPSSKPGSCSTA